MQREIKKQLTKTYNMKLKTLIIAAALLIAGTTATYAKAPKAKKTSAQQLIERMQKLQKLGFMYGHQDDPFYGITWEYEDGRSDTKDLVGDYPAVMGFELGGIEMGDEKNLDSVPFTRMRDEIIAHYKRGGIITISWHPRNPLLGTTAWIEGDIKAYNQAVEALETLRQNDLAKKVVNPKNTVKSILPGGSKHDYYMTWLEKLTTFFTSLKDDKGNQIPFIFRPYHENTGSWFWWGKTLCTDAEYLALWNMTQDFTNATEVKGGTLKDYLIWSYSPTWADPSALKRYPGDDRIELLGSDTYMWGTEADFIKQLDTELSLLTQLGKEKGKLIALTECGYQNSPDPTWWQRVFKATVEKYTFCYFLPWRNYVKEHFGASPDASTADDFKDWAKQKNLLFVNDIKKIK